MMMRIGVVGLGYVGLPLAVAFAAADGEVIGLDIDGERVDGLRAGRSHVEDVTDADLAAVAERVRWTTRWEDLAEADAVIIVVPTPLTPNREPDLEPLIGASRALSGVLRAGQLVVLESTTYPGTTRERLTPVLEESGLRAGHDFHVAYSPERIDPGNARFGLRTTPRVIGADDPEAARRAAELYGMICDELVPVSTPEVAEMAKLLENTFRAVNIALVNELAIICDRMGIDVWEVVEAAASKPFGFMSFDPGPGLGGHCLPIDPFYLAWKAREHGVSAEFVELAGRTNQAMPRFCVVRAAEALNGVGLAVSRATVAVLGVSYKPDVGDLRESPALSIMDELAAMGATLGYHDPHVAELPRFSLASESLATLLPRSDLTLIVTAHGAVDYASVVAESRHVLDFRGVTRGIDASNLARL